MFAVFLLLEILFHVILTGQAYIMMASPKSLEASNSRLNLCNKYSLHPNYANRRSLLCKLFNSFSLPFSWKRRNLINHNFDAIHTHTSLHDIIKFNEEFNLPVITLNDHNNEVLAAPHSLYSPPPQHTLLSPKVNSKFVNTKNRKNFKQEDTTSAQTANVGRDLNADASHNSQLRSSSKYRNYGRHIPANNYWNGVKENSVRISKFNPRPTKPTNIKPYYGSKFATWKPVSKSVSSGAQSNTTTTASQVIKTKPYLKISKISPNNIRTISPKSVDTPTHPKLIYVSSQYPIVANLTNSSSKKENLFQTSEIKLNAQITFSGDSKEHNLLGSESETNPYSIKPIKTDREYNLNSLHNEEEEEEIIIGKPHTDISESALSYTVEKSEGSIPSHKSELQSNSTHKPNFTDISGKTAQTVNYYELPINKSSIPGEPWTDYPMFSSFTFTNFTCAKPGFYSDKEYRCQVYHHCGVDNYHQKFICPNGTLFNDHTKSCDYWFNVNCDHIKTSIKITVDNDIDGDGNYSNHNMKGLESIEIVNNKFGSTLSLPRLGIVLESSIKVDDQYNKSQFISDLKKFVAKIEKHQNSTA